MIVMKLVCQLCSRTEGSGGDVQDDANDSTHEKAEEAETILADIEAVILDKDKGERLELVRQARKQSVMLRVSTHKKIDNPVDIRHV